MCDGDTWLWVGGYAKNTRYTCGHETVRSDTVGGRAGADPTSPNGRGATAGRRGERPCPAPGWVTLPGGGFTRPRVSKMLQTLANANIQIVKIFVYLRTRLRTQ